MEDEKIDIAETKQKAEQGNSDMQSLLGMMYENGGGEVLQSYVEAAKWYHLAAEQGDGFAQSRLGVMYYNGEGVPQNYRESYIWSSLAAANSIEKTAENRQNAARMLTNAELTRAQDEALKRMKAIEAKQINE